MTTLPTSSPAENPAELLRRVAQGDRQAFAGLYQTTSAKLFGIVLRILKRQELAEEIVQEVYIKIWQRASDFEPGRASPITWMAAIARNRALDEVRRRGLSLAEGDDNTVEVPDPEPGAEERLLASESVLRLDACLDRLDPRQASMVRLAYLDGWSRRDLASRFDQPVGTIKTWLHRSLRQLRDCLES